MLKSSLIFPLALSFFPAWLLILKNYDELISSDLFIAFSIVGLTFVICISVNKLIHNIHKTSLIIGMGIGFFFYFGYVQDGLKGIMFFGIPFDKTSILIPISILIFIILTIYILKSKRDLAPPVKIMNVVVVTALIVVIVPLMIPSSFAEKPNVYHIILDEYTDNEILQKKFGYDNSEFLEFLQKNDFQVPGKIFSISAATDKELSSILNMKYPESFGWASENYEKMNNNSVMSIFSENGYTIIETNSMMRYKNFSNVNEKLCYDTNFINSEFLDQILNKSIIRYFLEKHQENTRRDTVRCTFDVLMEIPSTTNKPTYVFSHLYVPHPPFLFDKNGENISPNHREISGLQSWENEDGYVNQLIYATDQTTMVIDNILQKDPSAIIVVQGDTGTLTGTNQKSEKTFDDVYQSHSILYAIRIPGEMNLENTYPINTYRIIFNNIFDMNYQYLEPFNFEIKNDGTIVDIRKKLQSHNFGG
tara:strand:- start:107 stop:1537 length:1431 start_codon:yes stop_codon:yes gene_type:complete